MTEWVELAPERRGGLKGMFAACPGLHGCVAAVLDGGMGRAFADDADAPTIGYLHGGFRFFAGAPQRAYVEPEIRGALVVPEGAWEDLLKEVAGERLQAYPRVDFGAAPTDRERLRALAQGLPEGFSMHRVTEADIAEYEALASTLVDNFPGHEAFLRDGLGFSVKHAGRIVAGCSSFMVGGGKLEIEIQTHEDFRRRGLATAVGAALTEHCLAQGIEPCWDAANFWSEELAKKLGYGQPRPYDAYWIPSAE